MTKNIKARPGSKYTDRDLREADRVLNRMAGSEEWWDSGIGPAEVLEEVLKDPSHPFRKHLDGEEEAVRKHWVRQIKNLMDEVRVFRVVIERGRSREVPVRVYYPLAGQRGKMLPLSVIVADHKRDWEIAKNRASYIRSWIGTTDGILASVPLKPEFRALKILLDGVRSALANFDDQCSRAENFPSSRKMSKKLAIVADGKKSRRVG